MCHWKFPQITHFIGGDISLKASDNFYTYTFTYKVKSAVGHSRKHKPEVVRDISGESLCMTKKEFPKRK